ncbi:IPExxxVDY family protein [Flavihumibacter fluvii]|uniref:IPExxxVDY family protein n=1 Tax=Flavihumibacter fluvii TaxID=2838157 RepID=UPI001BDEEF9B|nr:IPExxxVDY family protein [Flavihumibacter fluvii]ULQ51840.1 IPExxxVDY family protein [Flavihumibacter fluvii]
MKLKLDVAEMAEEFFEDAHLLGIVAPIKDYQFCWQLNQRLRFRFRINNDIEIQMNKKNRNYYFPIYEYSEPNQFRAHYLYKNQHDGEYLLPEFRHLDFLWLIKGDNLDGSLIEEIIQSIKIINGVQLVLELTNEKIKNKEHLIF